MEVGEMVLIDYGKDVLGRYWWKLRESEEAHGPFPTKAAALLDSEITTFGPQCKITDGGQWDPVWDKPQ
jgi:hypothetical protein